MIQYEHSLPATQGRSQGSRRTLIEEDQLEFHAPEWYPTLVAKAETQPLAAIKSLRSLGIASHTNPWFDHAFGVALLIRQRPHQALRYLSTAQQFFSALGADLHVLHCRRAQLFGRYLLGEGMSLQTAWLELINAYEKVDQPLEAARTQIQRGMHLALNGRKAEALALVNTPALKDCIEHTGSELDQARWRHMCGVVYTYAGMYAQAGAAFSQALPMLIRQRKLPEVVRCLFDRAWLWQRLDLFAAAVSDTQRARQLACKHRLVYLVAACTKNYGLALSRVGRYGDALELLISAQRMYKHLQHPKYVLGCQLNTAIIMHYGGFYQDALAIYKQLELAYAAQNLPAMRMDCQFNQAIVLIDHNTAEHATAAIELLTSIYADVVDLASRNDLADYHYLIALAYSKLGQTAAALEAFDTAVQLFDLCHNEPKAAECRFEIGLVYLEQGHIDRAEHAFTAVETYFASRPHLAWRSAYARARCAMARYQWGVALNAFQQANSLVALLRLSLIDEHTSSQIFMQATAMYAQALELALSQGNIETALSFSEEQRALTLLNSLKRSGLQHRHLLTSALVDTSSTSAHIPSILRSQQRNTLVNRQSQLAAFDLKQFRARCRQRFKRWMALVYLNVQDTLFIISITATDVDVATAPLTASNRDLLEQASSQQHELYMYGGIDNSRLQKISQLLLPPAVQSQLHPDQHLLIVPVGAMHRLAWAALYTDRGRLCQQAYLQIIPSLRLWQVAKPAPPQQHGGLFVGCSLFQDAELEPLDFVSAEWQVLQQQPLPFHALDAQTLSSTQLETLSANGQLSAYRIFHIASHGQLVADSEEQAFIALTADRLRYSDIAQLKLDGMLVILSLCQGAAATVLSGEEIISLNRAFLAAGAAGVIANVWSVDDELQPQMVELLYQCMQEHSDSVIALAHMQRRWLERHADEPAMLQPLIWAGFSFCGFGQ